MRVTCEKCKRKVDVKQLEKKKLPDDIEGIFFKCPKCKAEYLVAKTNPVIRQLMTKLETVAGVEEVRVRTLLKIEMDKLNKRGEYANE